MQARNSKHRRAQDWTCVDGATAEIVQYGQTVARGTIDGVTNDGAIVWVLDDTGRRRLYERSESFEVWVPRGDVGLNYRVSKAFTRLPCSNLLVQEE